MAKLKLSKQSLAQQREQLKLYRKLLPSLDLKRRQLTLEAQKAVVEHTAAEAAAAAMGQKIGAEIPMLAGAQGSLSGLIRITGRRLVEQNVVGVRVPALESLEIEVADYPRLATPAWVDVLVERLREAAALRIRAEVAGERVRILSQAVRRVTQRVNLFERILIPDAKRNIQRIQIFLGDLERAAVVTSKLAKAKQQGGRTTAEGLP
jgi:V/A-type H+-transporting ATPase subunit D